MSNGDNLRLSFIDSFDVTFALVPKIKSHRNQPFEATLNYDQYACQQASSTNYQRRFGR